MLLAPFIYFYYRGEGASTQVCMFGLVAASVVGRWSGLRLCRASIRFDCALSPGPFPTPSRPLLSPLASTRLCLISFSSSLERAQVLCIACSFRAGPQPQHPQPSSPWFHAEPAASPSCPALPSPFFPLLKAIVHRQSACAKLGHPVRCLLHRRPPGAGRPRASASAPTPRSPR